MKSIQVYEGPAFTSPAQVHSAPYNREPYVRVQLPDLGQVDAMVRRWSPTHVLIVWESAPGSARINAWVPAGWVQRIPFEESAWKDPYHQRGPWDD
ncbi:hypothetical protein [Micrococcus luteus]|uniref:hypothetical protein n=1 Tax=Micrococcus luteus TaxID=1270 RepID=UPI003F6E0D65|nr:hypothetical protein [Micrococcus luteus]